MAMFLAFMGISARWVLMVLMSSIWRCVKTGALFMVGRAMALPRQVAMRAAPENFMMC